MVKALVWGGGNVPNLVVILIYSAILDQRHRCFLHYVYYIAQYFLILTLRSIYAQPRTYDIDPYVY
jgi:hypothetical protein